MNSIYPWQHDVWAQLAQLAEKMPHALLITGVRGIGRGRLARVLAQALLCETTREALTPCGVCDSCRWFLQGTHPDFRLLAPEISDEKKTRTLPQIKIDAVRAAIDFVHMSAHRRGRRVVLIEPAECLNLSAGNALLKVLEEPPADVFFILIAEQAAQLLPTVRSRCRVFPLALPDPVLARTWLDAHGCADAYALARAGGAPLALDDETQAAAREQLLQALAKPSISHLLKVAQTMEQTKLPLGVFLLSLQKWLHDLACVQVGLAPRFHPDFEADLQQLARKASALSLHRFADTLHDLMPFAQHTLNVRLQLESLLLQYEALLQSKPLTAQVFPELV